MKATVINVFRDKNSKTVHQVGEELELTKKRFEEINSTAFGVFVEEIKEPAKTPEPPATPEGTNTPEK